MFGEFTKGLFKQNPVFVLMLGLCPTLAVTTGVVNACYMALAATAVLLGSNLIISLLRRYFPSEIRIPCFIVVIASLVTMVELAMAGFAPPEVNASLSIFIPLIVVNCIILGRAEAFASKHGPLRSVLDALGIGVGFLLALLAIAVVREVAGAGKLFGMDVFGPWYQSQSVLVLAPGAFLVMGGIFAVTALRGSVRARRQMLTLYERVGHPLTATDVKRQRQEAAARAEAKKREQSGQ